MTALLGDPPAKGVRSVAGVDEDAATLGVEAARWVANRDDALPGGVWFATTRPPYASRSNAVILHAALGLSPGTPVRDLGAAPSSGLAALRTVAQTGGLAVLADLWDGRPGSEEERVGGDGAAAFRLGDTAEPVAEVLGAASRPREVQDRWAAPGGPAQAWDAKAAVDVVVPDAVQLVGRLLDDAGVDGVDRLVVSGTNGRVVKGIRKAIETTHLAVSLDQQVGLAGAADVGLHLVATLAASSPGEIVAVVAAHEGTEALLLRTGAAVADPDAVRFPDGLDQRREVPYGTYLIWRGHLERQAPRRPEPEPPAAPASNRNVDWKFGLVAGRCAACDAVHAPPTPMCRDCGSTDPQEPHPLADVRGTIRNLTVDRLAWTLDPPRTVAVVDFDGGGRLACEVTDADADSLAAGDPVEMTFRRLYTANGIHDYFWKARPVARAGEDH